jgi:NAD(P)-dependent dehydrogenase (short-subunit alcohol dehydrogenase family)
MSFTLPAPVKTVHNDTYPAINPTRPELSLKGKVAIVTGAGSGVGRETAKAFAEAGAAVVLLGGRRKQMLEETKAYVEKDVPGAPVEAVAGDISDEQFVKGPPRSSRSGTFSF